MYKGAHHGENLLREPTRDQDLAQEPRKEKKRKEKAEKKMKKGTQEGLGAAFNVLRSPL